MSEATQETAPPATDKPAGAPVKPVGKQQPAQIQPKKELPPEIKDPRAEERNLADKWLAVWRNLSTARAARDKHAAEAERLENDIVPYTDKLVGRGERYIKTRDGTIIRVGRGEVEVVEVE